LKANLSEEGYLDRQFEIGRGDAPPLRYDEQDDVTRRIRDAIRNVDEAHSLEDRVCILAKETKILHNDLNEMLKSLSPVLQFKSQRNLPICVAAAAAHHSDSQSEYSHGTNGTHGTGTPTTSHLLGDRAVFDKFQMTNVRNPTVKKPSELLIQTSRRNIEWDHDSVDEGVDWDVSVNGHDMSPRRDSWKFIHRGRAVKGAVVGSTSFPLLEHSGARLHLAGKQIGKLGSSLSSPQRMACSEDQCTRRTICKLPSKSSFNALSLSQSDLISPQGSMQSLKRTPIRTPTGLDSQY